MNERPILFSGPMMRAILAGRKTQTRRVVKPQPTGAEAEHWEHAEYDPDFGNLRFADAVGRGASYWGGELSFQRCPHGKPGDRLWVRETWARYEPYPSGECATKGLLELPQVDVRKDEVLFDYWAQRIVYRADFDLPSPCELPDKGQYDERWRSPIHMPRWASRITLEITEVRVQRLQEISEEDAIAEGLHVQIGDPRTGHMWNGRGYHDHVSFDRHGSRTYHVALGDGICICYAGRELKLTPAKCAYRILFESINGPGSWDANPWVWAISFRPIPTAVSEVQA